MVSLVNAAPKLITGGINDQSRGTLVREPVTFPQHLPLLRLFTETGPETTTLVGTSGSGFNELYGANSLNRRSKYFNTQSLLAETLLAEGNAFFVKRLKPEDAGNPARVIVGIDIVKDMVPRRVDQLAGFNYPDQVPGTDPEIPESEVEGYRARIVLINRNDVEVGKQVPVEGNITSTIDGEQSTIYPLFEMPASFFGSAGKNLGFSMWSPTTNDTTPFDKAAADEFMTRMYRFKFIRRDQAGSSPVTIKTKTDDDFVDVCFDDGVYSKTSDREFYIGEQLIAAYEDDGFTSGATPMYAPFSEIYVYSEHLSDVQQKLYENELIVNPAAETNLLGPGQFDAFTGIDVDGYYYQGFLLEGPLEGGIRLGQSTYVYAEGGDDGTMDHDTYESLVSMENRNFGQLGDQYENIAVYPFSVIYDTGLSMEGKATMASVLGKRGDIRTVFTTFVEKEGRAPTQSEEISRAHALMAQLRAYPESTLHGTPVCRAEIILQTGRLAVGNYTKPVPQVIDYAQRWARFAGVGTGVLREGADIDESPNNRVELLKNLNETFFNDRVQTDLWSAGATYTLSYDHRSQYYPAIHSVYADDTSVLISPITVSICTDVMRLVRRVHAEFSGNAKLTKAQLIERCDNMILEMVDGRYGGRVQVIPETYFTDADDQRGFSWHCKVTVYANNPRTVMIFDLETRRMEDLG